MRAHEEIVSVHNPRVKLWTQLLERKGRAKHGLFLAEGIHLVQEAMRGGAVFDCVLYSLERGWPQELDTDGLADDVALVGVSEAVLAKVTDAMTPQPVVAILNKPRMDQNELLLHGRALAVAVDGVQDPGNLGTIIRSADAAGARAVILGKGTVDPFSPKTVRSTMGSLFHLPVVEADLLDLLPKAREAGVQVIGTDMRAAESCYELDLKADTWFVLGNEGSGMSAAVAALCSAQTYIPMEGQAESLNVAMAATVLLYESLRQRKYQ
ncbi:RNA methyltransferase [Xylanibacillus composti]|uniref:23S rRNA methyltransferase n=1 Tax=Xylanibacillus composti TaxID=1572762 RepID=A0A8J4H2T0_9BACL|nr:RNA methyltransferase [Xylanibacillus composti]MDT9723565.1 RNA methyltransferase [Xylanibacillus composti]GIQ68397.1 23S rRNA methyltransferase [Xylanibacillus composti]